MFIRGTSVLILFSLFYYSLHKCLFGKPHCRIYVCIARVSLYCFKSKHTQIATILERAKKQVFMLFHKNITTTRVIFDVNRTHTHTLKHSMTMTMEMTVTLMIVAFYYFLGAL